MRADPTVVERWRYLREILTQQLDRFEDGSLSLKSGSVDVSGRAIAKLQREILEFDALISEDDAKVASAR
jgi:hypothetical protein